MKDAMKLLDETKGLNLSLLKDNKKNTSNTIKMKYFNYHNL